MKQITNNKIHKIYIKTRNKKNSFLINNLLLNLKINLFSLLTI